MLNFRLIKCVTRRVRFKRCKQNLNMCVDSVMWLVNVQLIRVFLDPAHEEMLYVLSRVIMHIIQTQRTVL